MDSWRVDVVLSGIGSDQNEFFNQLILKEVNK